MDAEALITCARVNREDQPNALSEKRHNSVDSTEDAFESEPFPYTAVDGNLFTKDEDSSHFFFESKHHQLKENEDYQKLMTALVKLEAQKIQAIKDLETLSRVKEEALANPLSFIQLLQEGTLPPLPRPQEIAPVPSINWSRYGRTSSPEGPAGERHQEAAEVDKEDPHTSSNSILIEDGTIVVRGRKVGEDKPGSFNQLWTAEEQTRLEYLLQVYPSEKKEVRRWEKIAEALGNRTPKQVASRVQKYFIKLAKAGLPVPGRLPKVNVMHSNKPRKRKRTVSRARMEAFGRKTTFFATYQPEVYMPEDLEDELGEDCGSQGTSSGGPSRQEPADFIDREELFSGGNKDAGGSVLDAAYSSLDSPLLQSFVDKDYLDFETDGLDGGYNYLDTNFIPRS